MSERTDAKLWLPHLHGIDHYDLLGVDPSTGRLSLDELRRNARHVSSLLSLAPATGHTAQPVPYTIVHINALRDFLSQVDSSNPEINAQRLLNRYYGRFDAGAVVLSTWHPQARPSLGFAGARLNIADPAVLQSAFATVAPRGSTGRAARGAETVDLTGDSDDETSAPPSRPSTNRSTGSHRFGQGSSSNATPSSDARGSTSSQTTSYHFYRYTSSTGGAGSSPARGSSYDPTGGTGSSSSRAGPQSIDNRTSSTPRASPAADALAPGRKRRGYNNTGGTGPASPSTPRRSSPGQQTPPPVPEQEQRRPTATTYRMIGTTAGAIDNDTPPTTPTRGPVQSSTVQPTPPTGSNRLQIGPLARNARPLPPYTGATNQSLSVLTTRSGDASGQRVVIGLVRPVDSSGSVQPVAPVLVATVGADVQGRVNYRVRSLDINGRSASGAGRNNSVSWTGLVGRGLTLLGRFDGATETDVINFAIARSQEVATPGRLPLSNRSPTHRSSSYFQRRSHSPEKSPSARSYRRVRSPPPPPSPGSGAGGSSGRLTNGR
jgi:hypothetical protein